MRRGSGRLGIRSLASCLEMEIMRIEEVSSPRHSHWITCFCGRDHFPLLLLSSIAVPCQSASLSILRRVAMNSIKITHLASPRPWGINLACSRSFWNSALFTLDYRFVHSSITLFSNTSLNLTPEQSQSAYSISYFKNKRDMCNSTRSFLYYYYYYTIQFCKTSSYKLLLLLQDPMFYNPKITVSISFSIALITQKIHFIR